MDFDFNHLNRERIPYNPNPIFLGISFDENLCFNRHFSKLPDSPSSELSQISGIIPIKSRLIKLGVRYIVKAIKFNNPLTGLLISEYIRF